MKLMINYLLPFVGKHWIRIGILGIFLFLLNQKQIDLSIQLGRPDIVPTRSAPGQPAQDVSENDERAVFTEVSRTNEPSWTDQLNIFSAGVGSTTLLETLTQVPANDVQAFVRRFSPVAQKETEKYGVPTSIILANSLLHSQAGTRELSKSSNNLFALGCTNDWVGPKVTAGEECYRSYDNAWTSFRDHSLYVTTGHYAALPRLGTTNYRDWAVALEDMGYGGTDDLAEQLLSLIEDYQLFRYD